MLQEEVAWPHSAPATSWVINGPDAGKFEQGSVAGSIELTTTAMSMLTYGTMLTVAVSGVNAAGAGASVIVTYYIPALAKEYFVKYSTANQSGTGAANSPYKFMPQTADYTGSAKTFAAGDVVFFYPEVHRTSLMADKTLLGVSSHMTHAGAAGNPVEIELNGWGGRAQLLGDDLLSGASVSVTQSQALGSPDYANIRRFDMSTQGRALTSYAGVFDGDGLAANSKLYRAQFPLPVTPSKSKMFDPYVSTGSERCGMRGLPSTKSGATCMYTDATDGVSSGSTVTIKDPALATRYAGLTATQLNKVMIGTLGNHTSEFSLASFDNTNGIFVINCTEALQAVNGKVFYAIINCTRDVVQAGQYAVSLDGLTLDV
jgi:hypothetical protein